LLASSHPTPLPPTNLHCAFAVLSCHSLMCSHLGSITFLTPANNHDAEEASPTTPTPTQSQQEQQQQEQQ